MEKRIDLYFCRFSNMQIFVVFDPVETFKINLTKLKFHK